MRIAVLVAASLLAALTSFCSVDPPPKHADPPDPMTCPHACVHITRYQIDPAFDDVEQEAIAGAMRTWQRSTGGRECFEPGVGLMFLRAESLQEIAARAKLPSKLLQPIGLYQRSKVWVLGTDLLSYEDFRNVVAHEIGHWIGFEHINDRPSLMRAEGGGLANGLLSLDDRLEYCRRIQCSCATR